MSREEIDKLEQSIKLLKLKMLRKKSFDEESETLDKELNDLTKDILTSLEEKNSKLMVKLKDSSDDTGVFILNMENYINQIRQ